MKLQRLCDQSCQVRHRRLLRAGRAKDMGVPMGGDSVAKKCHITSDGRVVCWSEGFRCVVASVEAFSSDTFFAVGRNETAAHDKTLSDLATKLNELIKAAEQKAPSPQSKLGFLKTRQGLLPLWKIDVPNDEDIGKYAPLDSLRLMDDMDDSVLSQALKL